MQAGALETIPWASWVPAIIAAVASGGLAIWKSRSDLDTLRAQVAFKNEDTLNSLQARYISPLRAASLTLSRRTREIERKFETDKYGEVSNWFKIAKDHAVGDQRRADFHKWCYYEGTFALSTLYYTGVYFRCVHEIYAHAPFAELASAYTLELERHLENVRDAFDWSDEGFGRRSRMCSGSVSSTPVRQTARRHSAIAICAACSTRKSHWRSDRSCACSTSTGRRFDYPTRRQFAARSTTRCSSSTSIRCARRSNAKPPGLWFTLTGLAPATAYQAR